jgi:hypothetical protein
MSIQFAYLRSLNNTLHHILNWEMKCSYSFKAFYGWKARILLNSLPIFPKIKTYRKYVMDINTIITAIKVLSKEGLNRVVRSIYSLTDKGQTYIPILYISFIYILIWQRIIIRRFKTYSWLPRRIAWGKTPGGRPAEHYRDRVKWGIGVSRLY